MEKAKTMLLNMEESLVRASSVLIMECVLVFGYLSESFISCTNKSVLYKTHQLVKNH